MKQVTPIRMITRANQGSYNNTKHAKFEKLTLDLKDTRSDESFLQCYPVSAIK